MTTGDTAIALDASVLINLHASGVGPEVLRAQQARCVITPNVSQELGYEPIDGVPPRRTRPDEITIEPLAGDEFSDFITFARQLDDGEASILAIAGGRGFVIATDDRKALRIASGAMPATARIGTPILMRQWADVSHPGSDSLRRALRSIEADGRYRPRRTEAHSSWWLGAVA